MQAARLYNFWVSSGNKKTHAEEPAWAVMKSQSGSISRVLFPGCPGRRSFIWVPNCFGTQAIYPEVSDGPSLFPCGKRFPIRSCSRRGFPSIPGHPEIWWALTPPFHPYPCAGRSSFLWHCPWGRPLSRFGTALPCGARTFLPPFPGSDHLTDSDYNIKSEILNTKS